MRLFNFFNRKKTQEPFTYGIVQSKHDWKPNAFLIVAVFVLILFLGIAANLVYYALN